MKWVLLFLVTTGITQIACCQLSRLAHKETAGTKIKLGIKAGVSVANCRVSYDPEPPGNSTAKPKAGVAAIPVNNP